MNKNKKYAEIIVVPGYQNTDISDKIDDLLRNKNYEEADNTVLQYLRDQFNGYMDNHPMFEPTPFGIAQYKAELMDFLNKTIYSIDIRHCYSVEITCFNEGNISIELNRRDSLFENHEDLMKSYYDQLEKDLRNGDN